MPAAEDSVTTRFDVGERLALRQLLGDEALRRVVCDQVSRLGGCVTVDAKALAVEQLTVDDPAALVRALVRLGIQAVERARVGVRYGNVSPEVARFLVDVGVLPMPPPARRPPDPPASR